MSKLGTFIAGVVVGAVGLGVTACLVEGSSANSSCSDCSDEDNDIEENDKTENSICLNTEEVKTAQKTEEQAAQPKNDKLEKIRNAAEVLLEVLSKEKLYTTVN